MGCISLSEHDLWPYHVMVYTCVSLVSCFVPVMFAEPASIRSGTGETGSTMVVMVVAIF